MLYAVWRGWSGLVEGTRRRQGEKLTSMAGKMLAAAASSPDGGRLLLAPDGTHDPRHDEWWMRGSPKKHLARSPAVDVLPLLDTMAIFRADRVMHEVRPCPARHRYAASVWVTCGRRDY